MNYHKGIVALMIKLGVVKEFETPSCISGKPSQEITCDGEALCKDEKIKSIKHLSKEIDKIASVELNKSDSKSNS